MPAAYPAAFSRAAAVGHTLIMKALVEEGGAGVASSQPPSRGVKTAGAAPTGPHSSYNSAFCDACSAGHTGIMRALVEEGGVDAGAARSEAGHSGLTNAARHGRSAAVRMLLNDWGADVNVLAFVGGGLRDVTPLHAAVVGEHLELARMLILEGGADANKVKTRGLTPLFVATAKGNTALARMLVVEGGADVGKGRGGAGNTPPLYKAAQEGHTELARMLIVEGNADVKQARSYDGSTPLLPAAQGNHTDLARLLVEGKADVNKASETDTTPLYIAARKGYTELARVLVVQGSADVNQAREDDGSTPLHMACHKGYTELARMLVVEGNADVNQPTTERPGLRPLDIAVMNGLTELARMLLVEGKAEVNNPKCFDMSFSSRPLLIAAQKGHTELVRMLIVDGNADVNNLPNVRGWTAFHFAAERGHRDTCFALCALGADMDLSFPDHIRPIPRPIQIGDQPFGQWLGAIRASPFGSALKAALERRDHAAAIHLLQSRQVDRPTAKIIRKELLPIASTMGGHALARPVCERTRRVAEVSSELYSNRWSTKMHALCGEAQQGAVMAVMIIMLRTGRLGGGGSSGAAAAGSRQRPRDGDEGGAHKDEQQDDGREQVHQYEQVGKLPGWMHRVTNDAWWKVLEMMGRW